MSDVMRYDLDVGDEETRAFMTLADGGDFVQSEDFDRVVAERDALQLRQNAADQRIDDLLAEIATVRLGPCKIIVGDELP